MKAKKPARTRRSPEGPVRKGGTKPKPSTPKPDIKPGGQRPSKFAGAGKVAASRIGCPGVKMFRLSQLKQAGYNPRVIAAEAMEGLTNSISRFGCVEPIVVNIRGRKNVIIGGNQRFEALRSLGIAECLCVTVNCSGADEKLLNLTLNNPQIQGDFVKKIVDYIEQLRKELPDDNDFLNLRIADLQNELGRFPGKMGKVPDDDIPKVPGKVTARPGDLWVLGKHRLLCGDSTKEADIGRLMNGQKAVLFATDPPYGVGYTGKERRRKGKDWSDRFHDFEAADVKKFLKSYYLIGLKHVKKNTALYLWHASRRTRLIEDACDELDILIHQQIIWVKPCIVIGFSIYSWRHEPCLLMWKRGQKPYHRRKGISIGTVWPVGYDRSGDPTTPEYYTDVWDLDYDGKKRPAGIEHPTVKPVEVFAIPMRVHTVTGDICYEPFCGSGTQIIAAEKLDRRCYAIEKEPVFVDVAVERWERWTGNKAKLESKRK